MNICFLSFPSLFFYYPLFYWVFGVMVVGCSGRMRFYALRKKQNSAQWVNEINIKGYGFEIIVYVHRQFFCSSGLQSSCTRLLLLRCNKANTGRAGKRRIHASQPRQLHLSKPPIANIPNPFTLISQDPKYCEPVPDYCPA